MHLLTHAFIATAAFAVSAPAVTAQDAPRCSAGQSCHAPTSPVVGSVQFSSARVEPQSLRVGLGGYSPVSYLAKNKAEPGSPRFSAEHEGVTYFFTGEAQRRDFLADPDRYLPAYGGYCAFGCSVDSRFVPDPSSFKVIDGRTHLFLRNEEIDARSLWEQADAREVRAKADNFWAAQGASRAYVGSRNVPAAGLGIDGYSPVSYFTHGRAEKGDPRFSVQHNGVTYHLTSREQVEAFKKNPSKYEPRCGGWCAFGMSVQDKFPIDPNAFKIVDDRLYLFLNNDQINALDLWNKGDQAALTSSAEAHWRKVSGH